MSVKFNIKPFWKILTCHSSITLLLEHSPSWANETEHFEVFGRPQENQLVQRFIVKFHLLLFFLISHCWECIIYIQRNVSIMAVFKDKKTNLYNIYKIKFHQTSKCLWPIDIDTLVVKWMFLFDIFINQFPETHKSVYRNKRIWRN